MIFPKLIYTFFVAMIPAVEVKGAIPFGMALQLAPWQAYLMALCGSFFCGLFPGFFLHWFYVECKKHGFLKRFIGWIDKIVTKNKDKIHKYGPLAIFAYVAVPIPGTGTWTGSIIAGVLNMRPGITIFCVMCGNAVAGMIVMFGKFRRYSFDFTIVSVQSGIETGMDITKKLALEKGQFFLLCIRNVRERWGMESFMIVSHNNQKKIAVINDFSGFGRCSIAVSLPIISAMKIQCCPVPTSIFSNHTGFDSYFFEDYTDKMRPYIAEWRKLDLHFNGICTGFLGSEAQIGIVGDFLQEFGGEGTIVLIDPVMGDYGKPYPTYTMEMCLEMKKLVHYADILTPNLTEACILTDTPYKEKWRVAELEQMAEVLSRMGPGK